MRAESQTRARAESETACVRYYLFHVRQTTCFFAAREGVGDGGGGAGSGASGGGLDPRRVPRLCHVSARVLETGVAACASRSKPEGCCRRLLFARSLFASSLFWPTVTAGTQTSPMARFTPMMQKPHHLYPSRPPIASKKRPPIAQYSTPRTPTVAQSPRLEEQQTCSRPARDPPST